MMQKDYPMELACKNSKDFMDMCAVYFMHQIGSKHDDIKVVWNPETHVTYLELEVHYLREGKLRGLFPDRHVNGTMKLTLDNGWDWIRIDLYNLSEKDVSAQLFCLRTFVQELKRNYPDIFGEFNPSERE